MNLGLKLTDITFSIMKGNRLVIDELLVDSSDINLGKSISTSLPEISESTSEMFCLGFCLYLPCIELFLSFFNYSLVLCSITHTKVHFLLGSYQERYSFMLVEIGIHWPV